MPRISIEMPVISIPIDLPRGKIIPSSLPPYLSGANFLQLGRTFHPPPVKKSKTVLLVANGDLRQSANEKCWPAQLAMEQKLTQVIASLGSTLTRAHPYK